MNQKAFPLDPELPPNIFRIYLGIGEDGHYFRCGRCLEEWEDDPSDKETLHVCGDGDPIVASDEMGSTGRSSKSARRAQAAQEAESAGQFGFASPG
jgi:hypothetical protein